MTQFGICRIQGLRLAVLMLALMLLSLSAWAGGLNPPQQVIKGMSDELMTVLRSNRAKLGTDPTFVYRLADEVILPHIDFERVAALAMGKHWRKANQAQRTAFTREFKQLIVRTYATALSELSDWDIHYLPAQTRADQKNVVVRTVVRRGDAAPVSVDYRMHRREGVWLAYDVKIDGISLVSNYRSSFNQLVRQKGIDGLIAELAAQNATRVEKSRDRIAAVGVAR